MLTIRAAVRCGRRHRRPFSRLLTKVSCPGAVAPRDAGIRGGGCRRGCVWTGRRRAWRGWGRSDAREAIRERSHASSPDPGQMGPRARHRKTPGPGTPPRHGSGRQSTRLV